DCDELLAEEDLFAVLLKRGALFHTLHLVGALQTRFQGTEPLNKLLRRLWPDSWSTRNIVRRVSHESQQIGDLLRRDPEQFLHLVSIHHEVILGCVQNKSRIDNLV